jgi:hypothetical protein
MYNLLGDPALVLARPNSELSFMRTDDRWNPRVVVRVPAADFGGNVDIDWADAKGNTLSTRHYEARDRQFLLTIPDKAAQVRVYTSDTRTGRTAFGSLNLLDPPKPPAPPAPLKTQPPMAKPATTVHVVPTVKRPVDPRDRIVELDFDSPPPQAPPRTAADRREANALH